VLTLANGITITGSQDKQIRLWYNGKQEKMFQGHEDIVRDFTEIPGLGFASCSNDEMVKIWTMDGDLISELKGH
jgi:phospholipase A-2-activating protein